MTDTYDMSVDSDKAVTESAGPQVASRPSGAINEELLSNEASPSSGSKRGLFDRVFNDVDAIIEPGAAGGSVDVPKSLHDTVAWTAGTK